MNKLTNLENRPYKGIEKRFCRNYDRKKRGRGWGVTGLVGDPSKGETTRRNYTRNRQYELLTERIRKQYAGYCCSTPRETIAIGREDVELGRFGTAFGHVC